MFILIKKSKIILRELLSVKPNRRLKELYMFMILYSFASALIAVFEPIFFYQRGLSLSLIALYYAVHYTLYIFLMPLGAKFAARFGFERSLSISTPIFVVYFLLLIAMVNNLKFIWLAVIVLTVYKIFFWPAYHANFASITDEKNRGTEQSWARFITYGTGILGPLLGGFVIANYGFVTLFLVVAVTLSVASIPLLITREEDNIARISYTVAWKIIRNRANRRMIVSMIGWGENLVSLVFWPLFMFLMLGSSPEKLGIVVSLSTAIMTLWGFVIGEMGDRISARRTLRITVPFVAVGYILRMFSIAPWQVLLTDVYGRSADAGYSIPFMMRLYKKAREVNPLQYAVAFETTLSITKALLAWSLVVLFFYFSLPVAFTITFAIAGILSLFYRFI